jgi:hypothetical protein
MVGSAKTLWREQSVRWQRYSRAKQQKFQRVVCRLLLLRLVLLVVAGGCNLPSYVVETRRKKKLPSK